MRIAFSRAALSVAASVLFGLAHIASRGFPNWRYALVAGLAGWFLLLDGSGYQTLQILRECCPGREIRRAPQMRNNQSYFECYRTGC